jgi:hypothetical protein
MNTLNPKMMPYVLNMQAAAQENNKAKKDSINSAAATQSKEIIATFNTLYKANAASPVTTLILLQFSNIFPEIKENLASIYETLAPSAKKGPFAEFIDKTIASSAFGQIGMFWFNERNPDKIENDKVLQGYYHSHLILETIQDNIFEDPNRFLKKIYYQGSNPIIDRRYPNEESRNHDIIKAVIMQAEWLKVPNKKSINIKPIQDLKSLFVNPNEPNNGYLLKDLDRLGINTIIDKDNSSF